MLLIAERQRRDHRVLALLGVKAGFGLGAGVLVLLTVFAQRVFHHGEIGIGILMSARGVGALIGPFVGRSLTGRDDRRLFAVIGLSLVVFGIGYATLGLMPSIALAAPAVAFAHLGGGAQWTLSSYGLQRIVPDRIRGRVFAFDQALITLTLALSSLVTGWSASRFDPRWTAIALGGVAVALAIGAGVIVARYIAADPIEYDIKKLRSEGEDAQVARHWMNVSDKNFGRGYAGRTVIAADRLEQVPLIVEALHDLDKGKPDAQHTIGSIESIQMFVPADQQERVGVLDQIRAELDDPALQDLDDKEKAQLLELRPPDDLKPVTAQDLPKSLLAKFTEKDGRVGYLISIRPANHLDEWNGHDLIRFADAVRELHLPDGETVTTSGSSVIFADIVESIERDGPLVTSVALIGLIIMVVLLVGRNRRAVAVMVGVIGGSLLMIAVCALLDIKVNFLDFVALPITLGLGIDYAINVAHRHDAEEIPDPITTLRTSGSAVFVCSLTTIIGYGSLLVSENLAIRGFGTASLIGEVACVLSALVLVPAILALGQSRGVAATESAAA